MTTLSKYLQDIAVAVLKPIGYLYGPVGATKGVWGYSGIHSQKSNASMWQQWTCIATVDLFKNPDGSVTGKAQIDVPCITYCLYWTADDGMQGSWWVEKVSDSISADEGYDNRVYCTNCGFRHAVDKECLTGEEEECK